MPKPRPERDRKKKAPRSVGSAVHPKSRERFPVYYRETEKRFVVGDERNLRAKRRAGVRRSGKERRTANAGKKLFGSYYKQTETHGMVTLFPEKRGPIWIQAKSSLVPENYKVKEGIWTLVHGEIVKMPKMAFDMLSDPKPKIIVERKGFVEFANRRLKVRRNRKRRVTD